MGQAGTSKAPPQVQGPSPAQVAQGPAAPTAGPSMDSLVSQVSTMQDSMGNLQNQLKTKNLQLSRPQQHLLRNKLSDTSTYLRAANGKLGIETPPMPSPQGGGAIERFINFISDGENQLNAAKQKIMEMKKNGDKMNPADMLLIQVKMNQAQQEIEYSSTLLSKVITSLTQILNTQL